METKNKDYQQKKGIGNHQSTVKTQFDKNIKVVATGTCLSDCVKCGSPCCFDAGHPGPHYCYLCK